MDGENRNFPDESTQIYKKKQISLLVIYNLFMCHVWEGNLSIWVEVIYSHGIMS